MGFIFSMIFNPITFITEMISHIIVNFTESSDIIIKEDNIVIAENI